MQRPATLVAILALILCLPALAAAETPERHTVHGTYLRSELGDYYHLVFLVDGQELSVFCHPYLADAMDAIRPETELTVTYSVVDTYIPEADDVIPIEVLESIMISDPWTPDASILLGVITNRE